MSLSDTRIANQSQKLPFGPPEIRLFFFKIFFFLMWTIFKVFTEFVTILLLFYVLVFWP